MPKLTPRSLYLGPLGYGKLQKEAQKVGAKIVQQGRLGAQKMTFFKNDPRPHGMPKQVFLARYEPVVARCGPRKIPKCLENGLFWDQMGKKNVVFPKMIPEYLGCPNK